MLHDDTWYDKIVADHAEVADRLDAIVDVLARPDRVNFDALQSSGENFYGPGYFEYPYQRRYLKVVVRYEMVGGQEVGTVVSAYPARDYRKRGERYKWHRR